MMSDRLYDILDWFAENLPYVALFWVAIAEAWNLPFAMPIEATIVALAKLLQALVKKSAIEYYKEEE